MVPAVGETRELVVVVPLSVPVVLPVPPPPDRVSGGIGGIGAARGASSCIGVPIAEGGVAAAAGRLGTAGLQGPAFWQSRADDGGARRAALVAAAPEIAREAAAPAEDGLLGAVAEGAAAPEGRAMAAAEGAGLRKEEEVLPPALLLEPATAGAAASSTASTVAVCIAEWLLVLMGCHPVSGNARRAHGERLHPAGRLCKARHN